MLRYLIIILVFTFAANTSFSRECKTITKFNEYHNSEIIILGYITEKGDKNFNLEVLEVFKGDDTISGSKISGLLGEDLINPDIGETWLLYASFSEKVLVVNICGHSRSFDRPYSIGGNSIPPPPSSNENFEEAQDVINNIYVNRALSELRYDIMDLRYKKLQNQLSEFKNNNSNMRSYSMWLLFGFSLLFFGFGIYCFLFRKSSQH